MIGIFGFNLGVALVLLVAVLIAIAVALESERGRMLLRRFAWFRRLEQLSAEQLRDLAMITLGVGVCCFAALLTLQLFAPAPRWLGVTLAFATVLFVTVAAGLSKPSSRA